MGIGGHPFLAAATILDRFYDNPVVGLVETSIQGYSSTTYIATFSNGHSVVLQFRPFDRRIDEDFHTAARKQISDLAPSIRLLTTLDSALVYELTRIHGIPFCEIHKVPNFVQLLPSIADGLGGLLGKCCVEGSSCRTDRSWVPLVIEQLKRAAETTDPLLLPFKDDFTTLLDGVQSGQLDDLPLSITNGDMTPTNLMVTEQGLVAGLVDWEMMHVWPLGFELCSVHWIKGYGRGMAYSLYENAEDIENRFWAAFMASVPQYVVEKSQALQFAMKVGTVLNSVTNGECYFPQHISCFRAELDYTIPQASLLI